MKAIVRLFALCLAIGFVVFLFWWSRTAARREHTSKLGTGGLVSAVNKDSVTSNSSASVSGGATERVGVTRHTGSKSPFGQQSTSRIANARQGAERLSPSSGSALPRIVLPSPWSEWLTNTADYAHIPPRARDIPETPPEVQQALMEMAWRTDDLRQKVKIFRWLALRGDGSVAPLMIETLTHKYKSQTLSSADERRLLGIPALLGIAARRSDEALRFLIEASDPAYWIKDPPWKLSMAGCDPTVLAGFCIQGLMRSERQEAMTLLDRFKAAPPGSVEPELARHVADAAFAWAIIRDMGLERALDVLAHGDSIVLHYTQWGTTTEGKQWAQWLSEQGAGTPAP